MLFVVQLQALQSQLDFQEQSMVDKSQVSRQEARARELDSRLEFEKTQVKRLEVSPQQVGGGRQRGANRVSAGANRCRCRGQSSG